MKRFQIETQTTDQRFSFITEHKQSKLVFASVAAKPKISYAMRIKGKKMEGELDIADFIDVKGWKSIGNKLSDHKLSSVKEIVTETPPESNNDEPVQPGDTIELDF